jgi:FlaA1/EpsC-like NDP-sugar epimerase
VWQVLAFAPEKIIMVDQAETPLHHLILQVEKQSQVHRFTLLLLTSEIMQGWTLCFNCINHMSFITQRLITMFLMEENPAQAVFTNVMGTKNVADLALRHQVEKFVMVSTDRAVNPTSVMGASKRIAEKYIHNVL